MSKLQTIKHEVFRATIFFGTGIMLMSIAYAAISWPSSPPTGETAGGKYASKLVPTGFVGAFELSTCPSGWSAADGTNGHVDLRGEFIRGWDNGRGVDSGRTNLTSQRGSLVMNTLNATNTRIFGMVQTDDLGYDVPSVNPASTYHWLNVVAGTAETWPQGTVDSTYVKMSRPRNVALLYCVKN